MFEEMGVSRCDVEETLAFIVQTAVEDALRGDGVQRLQDPVFLDRHFRIFTWHGEAEHPGLEAGQIRLTRYLVYQMSGRQRPDGEHPYALYERPSVDADPQERWREHTRQDVLDGGIYRAGGNLAGVARPLVWLSRTGVLEAMMQGTIEVELENGMRRLYNVHRRNRYPYRRGYKDEAQQAYFYFRRVADVRGWKNIPVLPEVSVAGDVYNVGLGKVVALESNGAIRLAVLSDTGGAFQPNLSQLDVFTGAYPTKEDFLEATAHLPEYPKAYLLLLKPQLPTADRFSGWEAGLLSDHRFAL